MYLVQCGVCVRLCVYVGVVCLVPYVGVVLWSLCLVDVVGGCLVLCGGFVSRLWSVLVDSPAPKVNLGY